MSDERLRELYTESLATRPAGEHATPEAIAGLVRREGSETDRLATLDHVMRCVDCKRDFDLLRTIERAGIESGAVGRAATRPRWLMPAALAASVLLAVGIGRGMLRAPDDTTRGEVDSGAVTLVRPGRAAPAGAALTFAWRPVAGARRYELELLDAGGNVAASAATADTSATLPAVRNLPAGDYRWWVRATTADARSLTSAMRPLRLSPR